jgi:multiple sugar transport system ATP-binding protein
VALGRALVRRPRLFLFDEPLSNLDPALRTEMRAELKQLHDRLRATFVYVTHDQGEAMTLSDRVVVMDAGQVQQIAPPRDLYAAPANLFVAGFFGTPRINLVSPALLGLVGAERMGVRAEHVTVGTGPPPQGATLGQVFLVEPMGAESWVTVCAQGERVTARAAADFAAAAGAPIWIQIDRRKLLWFDRAGRRIAGERPLTEDGR